MAAPANDNFANAIRLAGDSGRVTVNVTDATVQAGEPVGSEAGHANQTIWYRLDGDGRGHVIELIGSYQTADPAAALDTVLAVYTGPNLAGLIEVVSSDDALDISARVAWDAAEGTTYWIQAGTYSAGEAGSIVLSWAVLEANDTFAEAEPIASTVGTREVQSVRRTTGTPIHGIGGTVTMVYDLWYAFTAETDGVLKVSTQGSKLTLIDSIGVPTGLDVIQAALHVFTGTDLGDLTIADGTALGFSDHEVWTVPVTAGATYYIEAGVDLSEMADGPLRISWRLATAAPVGIAIAPDYPALATTVFWTRLDEPDAPWRVTGFSVDRGKRSELERNDAGTAVIDLIDLDGTFDPTNPSATFPLTLACQAKITVQNPVTGEWRHLFTGFTKEYPGQFYTTGRLSEVPLQLADGFEYLQGILMYPDDPVRFGDDPPTGVGPNLYFPQTTGTGQVRARLKKALNQAGWPSGWRHLFSGNIKLQAWQYPPGTAVFNVLEEAVEAEFPAVGVHFMSRRGNYVFRGRYPRFNPDGYLASDDDIRAGPAGAGGRLRKWKAGGRPQAEADLGTEGNGYRDGTAVIADLAYSHSWNDVINAALALPNNVADTDVPGNLVTDSDSIDQYGWRAGPDMENLLVQHGNTSPGYTAVEETRFYAEYWVENFKQPITRITSLLFRPRDAQDPLAGALWAFMLGVELGDVVHVETDHFDGAGGFDDHYFIEGIHYRASNLGRPGFPELELELDVSPRGFYSHNPWGSDRDGDTEDA